MALQPIRNIVKGPVIFYLLGPAVTVLLSKNASLQAVAMSLIFNSKFGL